MAKIKIDAEDLILAFETRIEYGVMWLDRETGNIELFNDYVNEEVGPPPDWGTDRYVQIVAIPSRQGYRHMEAFIDQLPAGREQEALWRAIQQRKPFRRFKDTLHNFGRSLEAWYAFKHAAMLEIAQEWIEDNELDAELVDRRSQPPATSPS